MPHDQAYYEAEKKIEQALKSGATTLDLSGSREIKLTEVPEILGDLTQLRQLMLQKNQLASLPKSIEKLTQLVLLDISNNQLISLPKSFGKLYQLESLEITEY